MCRPVPGEWWPARRWYGRRRAPASVPHWGADRIVGTVADDRRISGWVGGTGLYDIHNAYSARATQAYRDAARHLGIMLVERPVRSAEEAKTVLGQIQKGEVDGLLQAPSAGLNIPGLLLEVMHQQGIPAMFTGSFRPEQGAAMVGVLPATTSNAARRL